MATLTLVATPIGNLGDLAPRAVEALAGAALVCCEDTRRTGRLLQHAGIGGARLLRVDEHTEVSAAAKVLDVLDRGGDVAVVTDAGTPGISDPGERLVRAVLDAGYEVSAVPGPAALVMALVLSGLPSARFVFEGFLARSGRERADRLRAVAGETRTVVLYEAPHRLARTLADLAEVCGPSRRVAVCRELTKLHEEVWRGTLAEAIARAGERDPIGEHALVLEGAPPAPPVDDDAINDALRAALGAGCSKRDAATPVAAALGVPKRRAYDLALRL